MKEICTIYANVSYIICPYCESEQYGWLRDPRGIYVTCDECKNEYLIPKDADIVIL